MDKKCSGCGKEYWRNQQWIHDRCATNGVVHATNDGARIATNKRSVQSGVEECHFQTEDAKIELPAAQEALGIRDSVDGVRGRTANRRSREAFNAYQREYMKTYRARKRA